MGREELDEAKRSTGGAVRGAPDGIVDRDLLHRDDGRFRHLLVPEKIIAGKGMKSKGATQQILPSRPPISLIILAVLFFMLPIVIHPKFLIYLGPFGRSLTSANELTRHTALIELNVLRAFCFILFVAITTVLILWRKLLQSTFINSVMEYKPL